MLEYTEIGARFRVIYAFSINLLRPIVVSATNPNGEVQ